MTSRKVRVRFAPSPTGPLHMGGVRTALYNYLFAKKNNGDFILRIEDTDQNRFVPGAEAYIIESLKWCGIEPNEGLGFGDGHHAPYRQSERKALYRKFAEQLVQKGYAYYAFDTSEALDAMRKKEEGSGSSFFYNAATRMQLKNSLSLHQEEVNQLIQSDVPHVIRLKVPADEEIKFTDLIRGEVSFNSNLVDDKVLLKSDGMPTYHLAHIVDDYLMQITHAIRGEEWLPSAPAHILIYRYLGWEEVMPLYAHLPLLLKPDGNGKLSKRDGDRLGFPVFPLEWKDPATGEVSSGYRERGYYAGAFINMLAFLGWNPGTEQEIFSLEELCNAFSFEHVHKAGAKFDPEKTKWFNQQYLRKRSDADLALDFLPEVKKQLEAAGKHPDAPINPQDDAALKNYVTQVCSLIKDKATFVNEFWYLSSYLFFAPSSYDETVIGKKWNADVAAIISKAAEAFEKIKPSDFDEEAVDYNFKKTCEQHGIKPGSVMQILRVCISGRGAGVDLLRMCALLGRDEVVKRMHAAVSSIIV